MSKFNSKVTTKKINKAGGIGYSQDKYLELVSLVLTSFLSDKFYESSSEQAQRLTSLIETVDPLFVAKTALFARREFGMRSVSHFVAAEIAKRVKGEEWTKRFFEKIIYRADDMTEILALYLSKNGKPIPNSLKKGFAKALQNLNEYKLAKYQGKTKAISLIDVINLVRPKHTDAIGKLVRGELVMDTWETKLIASQGNLDKKAQAWEELLREKKLGYLALLRNLRNIKNQAPNVIDLALEQLTDKDLIKKSLIFPFQFLTALQQLQQEHGSQNIIKAINKAMDIAVDNTPRLDGSTLIVLDTSGSMMGRPALIGSIFSATLIKSNPTADFMVFSDDAKYMTLNSDDSLSSIAKSINFISGGTNFHSIFEKAEIAYDRIIILSDMQGWIGDTSPVNSFINYKARTGANPHVYSFDLQGYGTMQFPENQVYALAGFSNKVLDLIKLLEVDKKALINTISQINI